MKRLLIVILLGLAGVRSFAVTLGPACVSILTATQADVTKLIQTIPEAWILPASGTEAYEKFASSLMTPMHRELSEIGHWDADQTAPPRLALPVARLTQLEVAQMARPRLHEPLPSFNSQGLLFFPEHVLLDAAGKPIPSETFHVRMMVIKDKGSLEMNLPASVEYLRPFFEKAWALEQARDPVGFKNRYAFIQVDASWVDAQQNQARPGKTTSQNADPSNRQGSHVDGFLQQTFWDMQEDVTYAVSFGFDPETQSPEGDSIPTEFFNVGFPIPAGLTHPQARVIYDQIANQNPDKVVTYPAGIILRMSSRVIHRVGVALRRTYRSFAKVKFTDQIFNQAENTVNLNVFNKPIYIYTQWQSQGVPLVDRKTLPTEGIIMPADAHWFQNGRLIHVR